MRVRVLLLSFACLLTGFALGRATSTSTSATPSPSTIASLAPDHASAPDTDVESPIPLGRASAPQGQKFRALRPGGQLVGPGPLEISAEREQALQDEVGRLRKLVDAQQASETEAVGSVIAFPEGRSARADEQTLHAALRKAFANSGLSGDVNALDCSEFPCIAHGEVKGDVNQEAVQVVLDKAKQAVGGLLYASVSKFVDKQDPSQAHSSFSLAVYPDGLPQPEQDNLNKRLRHRKNAYVDASRGE